MKKLIPLAALLMAAAFASVSHAQTFSVTPSTGTGPFTVSWDIPNGTSCQASGLPSWTGAQANKGTKQLTPAVGSYSLGLACTVPGVPLKGSVTLSWIAPTQNVDNSPLTNLAGYQLFYGTSAAAQNQQVNITSGGITRYTVDNLDAATYFFSIKAVNSAGVTSDPSATVSKAVTDTATTTSWSGTLNITVTAPPKPKPPVLSVEP